ncbi:helix-turn-helix domain-containing protein [Pandoraea communis]|uniref:helix-turn-helix domain-containing protein n=1 Tax=Pandoraea communis TaxID=2508297 RepID=UPI0025A60F1C|nr:LysR family transcriptional regulator [Pandoraea communis]MDM8357224.1 LysR family transcriptional regulator [Pandoraea communis]
MALIRVTFHQFEALVAIAELHSFAEAGNRLESVLGFRIFDRTSPAAEGFVQFLLEWLPQWNERITAVPQE